MSGAVGEQFLKQIKAVSSRVRLADIGELLNADRQGDKNAREAIDAALFDAEVYCGPAITDIVQRAPKLQWIQSLLAGVDQYLTPDFIASPIILTKAKIHDRQISENIFSYILAFARHTIDYYLAQTEGKQARFEPVILYRKTLGIMGLGNIGQRTAKIARAFGMKVIATRSHPDRLDPNVDIILPPDGLAELLKDSDFVVDLLPATPETENIMGEAEFKMMKPTAFFINVGRGSTVNTEALIKVLKDNWIAGAALDALASDPGPWPEPLVEAISKLNNIVITPHVSGQRPDYNVLLTQQLCQNLRRYIQGKELIGVVDKNLGF